MILLLILCLGRGYEGQVDLQPPTARYIEEVDIGPWMLGRLTIRRGYCGWVYKIETCHQYENHRVNPYGYNYFVYHSKKFYKNKKAALKAAREHWQWINACQLVDGHIFE